MTIGHALLALLHEDPDNGNQLRHKFENSTGQIWALNSGQVYATLERLKRHGWVHPDSPAIDAKQHRFRITPQGQKELAAWFQTPPDLSTPPRDELVIKILTAIHVPGADVLEMIRTHREHLARLKQASDRTDHGTTDPATALVAEAQSGRINALIRWLDTAEHAIAKCRDDHSL